MNPLTIASVPYLNARPLIAGLSPMRLAPPAALHEAMLGRTIDVALLPVVAFLENPELKILPDLGIVSRGAVLSVRALHRGPGIDLSNCESVCLDPDSKTSQKLLKVILMQRYGRNLEKIAWVREPETADTVLRIGDPALLQLKHPYATDLGQEWQALTGLPFVYACWMSRSSLPATAKEKIYSARIQGESELLEIIRSQSVLSAELAHRYLSRHIFYQVGASELLGLQLFFEWVQELKEQNYDTALRFVA